MASANTYENMGPMFKEIYSNENKASSKKPNNKFKKLKNKLKSYK